MRFPSRASSIVALCLAFTLQSVTPAWELRAENGDIDYVTALCGSSPQSAGADLAYDSSDDTLWVVDQGNGQCCHYDLSAFAPEISLIEEIPHPFGGAIPPFFTPLTAGITYRASTGTLFVLDATNQQIVEMDKQGNALGSNVVIQVPQPGSSITSLAYDSITDTLWTRDKINAIAIEFNPTTGEVISTIDLPGDDLTYGAGLACVQFAGQRYLEFSYGNVLDYYPSRVIRINALNGSPACVEVDLTQIPERVLGIVRPPTGSVIYASTQENVYKIDSTNPSIAPPADLTCRTEPSGDVSLSWTNCGPGAGGIYSSIRILRDNAVIVTLGGSSSSYQDNNPSLSSELTYEVQGIVASTISGSSCVAVTGAGGLVSYSAFDGISPFDLALDPLTTELYVTDSFSGVIYVYDTDLNLIRSIDTGLSNLHGVAFNHNLSLLLVSRANSSLLSLINPNTGEVLSSIPAGSNEVSSLTYDVANDHYLIVDEAVNPARIVRLDADPNSQGNFVGSLQPPATSGLILSRGACTLQDGNLLTTIITDTTDNLTNGINELNGVGFPTNFGFTLDQMGLSVALDSNAAVGIENFGNILYVAGHATGSLFKILVSPGGSDFIRGDVDNDGGLNLADAISALEYLYAGGTEPTCLDSVDVNDDGFLDISDPLFLILYLFTGASSPPEPFPASGPDPTFLDGIGC